MHGPGTLPGLEVLFAVSQQGEQVNGAGTFFAPFDTLAISVYGSHRSPNFAVTLSNPAFYSIGYAGVLIGDTLIRGTITGSGFVGESLTVRRQ